MSDQCRASVGPVSGPCRASVGPASDQCLPKETVQDAKNVQCIRIQLKMPSRGIAHPSARLGRAMLMASGSVSCMRSGRPEPTLSAQWQAWVAELKPMAGKMGRLDVVDGYAGCENVTSACRCRGLACEPYDLLIDKQEMDITTAAGQKRFILMHLRAVAGALSTGGPPCKYWIWLTKVNHARTMVNPTGDPSLPFTQEGNVYGDVVANSILLFKQLGIHFLYESPGTSVLFEYPPVKDALEAVGATQIRLNMGWVGARTRKPTLLVSDCLWLKDLQQFSALRPFVSNMDGRQLTSRQGNRVNGVHALLTESAEWPAYFCTLAVDYHIAWTNSKFTFIKLLQVEPLVKFKLGADVLLTKMVSAYVSLEIA